MPGSLKHEDTTRLALIANARMYSSTPRAAAAWRALFEIVADRADVALTKIDHPFPAPLEALWERDDLGAAFMCGWPYARNFTRHRLVAAPVPSPPRYEGRPIYFTDFVVRADSSIRSLNDVLGLRFAYTVETSHSGWNAPRHHLLKFHTPERTRLFAETLGPFVTPLRALAAVIDGTTDAAPIDSYVIDLIRAHDPATAATIRVIETTEPAPVPPLVASPATDPAIAVRIGDAFVALADDRAAAPHMAALLLKGFARPSAGEYRIILERAAAAEAAGYARIV